LSNFLITGNFSGSSNSMKFLKENVDIF
jgi:hypothetical protein